MNDNNTYIDIEARTCILTVLYVYSEVQTKKNLKL